MLVIAVAACVVCCLTLVGALVHRPRKRARARAESQRVELTRLREEDRARPAIDAAGEPIWLEDEDVLWHEIVCWPTRRRPRPDQRDSTVQPRRRAAR